MRQRIYVAGPYTKGDVAVNVRNAFAAANALLEHGFAPFVPHYTHFWHMLFPRSYEAWLDLDLEFLLLCQGVLRLEGESQGADREVAAAESAGIPVFREVSALVAYFPPPGVHE